MELGLVIFDLLLVLGCSKLTFQLGPMLKKESMMKSDMAVMP